MPHMSLVRATTVAVLALFALPSAAQQPGAQQPGAPGDLGPQMRRVLAPLQPQDYALRPVARSLGDLLNQGWEMVSAGGVNAAELYVLRQRGKYVRCLLLPTDMSNSRPERISLCAELN
jgi:hypothetical protein